MKVLISADMEGTCGVVSWVQVMPPEVAGHSEPTSLDRYLRTRERMTAEVNAAVEGALAGGASEVIVNDSHDGMRNLIPEQLHPEVRYITGNDKPDRKSTRLNSSHANISYAVFCLKKK